MIAPNDAVRIPVLGHDAYWMPSAFSAEMRDVFARTWLFAGLAPVFATARQSLTLAGMSVTIEPHGDGFRAKLGAAAAEVDRCGQFLFVRPIPGGQSLAAFLAPYVERLEAISQSLARVDHTSRVIAEVNWKVLVENTLDDCHAATVHTRTLQPAMDPSWLSRYQPERHGAHSMMGNDLGAADVAFWNRLATKLPLARHHQDAVYKHLFIFPNFYVATFFGAMVMLHRIDPIAPELSALELMTCLPVTRPLARPEQSLHAAVLRDLIAKAGEVVAEDLAVCRLAQWGHHFAIHQGILGTRECRVDDFQQTLRGLTASP